MRKQFYTSKTFWTNVIALVVFLFGPVIGIDRETLDAETMVKVLAVLNVILRFITKSEITLN